MPHPTTRLSRLIGFFLILASRSHTVAAENAFLDFIQHRASEERSADAPPDSLGVWEKRREALRARLTEAWGGFPDAAVPLMPQKLGELRRDGYRVEKIIFQTFPGVWMTANAYVPDVSGKRPAVLCVHGHWRGAKQDPNVQARCIGLAKLGFFVLAVDAFGAGERGLGKRLGEYHGEMVAATLWPIGRPLSGLQVWENRRAVDYLLTRPEVDPERLGITGASGGGNQTMYAGAFDGRFKAVVPVCSVGNYQAYLGAACCMCEVVPGALQFTEEWGVLALTAPRALMVVNATRDAHQFSVDEAKKSLALVGRVYGLFGQPQKLRHAVFESPHAYNRPMREAMYGWMTLHLKGEGDGAPLPEPAMQIEDPEALRCFPGESRPDGWLTIPRFAAREGRALIERIEAPASTAAWRTSAARMRRRLRRNVLGDVERERPAREGGTASTEDRIKVRVERGVRLDARLGVADGAERTVLLLDLEGEAHAASSSLATALEAAGHAVVSFDLRATGGLAYAHDRIGRAPDHNTAEWSLWLGRPLLGQWVLDVQAVLDAIETDERLPNSVTVVGTGPAGVVATCAAALDKRIDQVVTRGSLGSFLSDVPYEGQRLGVLAPGILRDVGDIEHLAALIAPRRQVIVGSVNGAARTQTEAELEARFAFTRRAYAVERASGQLTVARDLDDAGIARTIAAARPEPVLRAGAAVVDVTPETLPVIVNGGMLSRTVGKVNTRLHARSLALSGKETTLVIVVVDSCMMPRPLLDAAKTSAAERTGIPKDHLLISATHAHSAPSCMGALGTDADPAYAPFLETKLVEAIEAALSKLQPARVGFGREKAAEFTALRRWIRRPDRVVEDPFGNSTVRANMHAARDWDDVTGASGPEDPELSLLSVQSKSGRPIAVLANFSMHYFGDRDLSADYFGRFCAGLKMSIAPDSEFVGILSHGPSGDIWRRDYSLPKDQRGDDQTIDQYTNGLLKIALRAYESIEYRDDVDVAMVEHRMILKYRVPDRQRLEWARRIVASMGDRLPENQPEVYAREQIILHERQETEIVIQAARIGDIGIATTPCETYALTGLKIKAASPLPDTMVIELANGGDGYIPPPEQHLLGGYNTWAARSAGLEVTAEPKIAEACIELLERVSEQPRRATQLSRGPAARAIDALHPAAWWRLDEFTGPRAVDASGHQRDAIYEPGVTFFLQGPRSNAFCADGETNRAAMFAGGRLQARVGDLGDHYSVSLWLWNGMPNEGRPVSGWLISRDRDHGVSAYGDHLGVGGTSGHTGRLVFFHGARGSTIAAGKTEIPRWSWRHVVFVRDGESVRVYLNGALEIETTASMDVPPSFDRLFIGGRSDNESGWEGRLDEVAVFGRALSAADVSKLTVP